MTNKLENNGIEYTKLNDIRYINLSLVKSLTQIQPIIDKVETIYIGEKFKTDIARIE